MAGRYRRKLVVDERCRKKERKERLACYLLSLFIDRSRISVCEKSLPQRAIYDLAEVLVNTLAANRVASWLRVTGARKQFNIQVQSKAAITYLV